jgi:hypothetical protein
VAFTADDLTRIVAHMDQLAAAEDGWINLIPKVSDDDEKPTALRFFTLFGGGSSGVTMGTWIPAGQDQMSLGITHVTGRRAAAQLRSSGNRIPESWLVEQDHPRRGLVLRVPSDESHERVLVWELRAVSALMLPRPYQQWRADIYLSARGDV